MLACTHIVQQTRWRWDVFVRIFSHFIVAGQGIEDLTLIREVCLQREDASLFVRELLQVQIEDLIASLQKLWNGMASGFA